MNGETIVEQAQRFISNPYGDGAFAKLFKTGDLARWLPDGNLEFIGRKDSQIKIHGQRVELVEIENILLKLPFVTACTVQKWTHLKREHLIAYVVAEQDLDQVALKQHLSRFLPPYMTPDIWIRLNELPLTASGKLNPYQLPKPDSRLLEEFSLENKLKDIYPTIVDLA
ncbi:MAG: hypothetical protein AAF705_13880 [Bacteroidota bacterium]